MLSHEENELICRTGTGTPMGELFRRFWLPVALAEEIPGPDCDPVRVQVLGEHLVLFRDTQGRPSLVDAYCPHRGAPLFFGRNEECGLRCVYHGWKFDVDGNCVDMPNVSEGETFKAKVKLQSYPVVEAGDLLWAYMGPADKKPPLPGFDWLSLPSTHRYVKKFRLECNYLQAMEGDYDASHASFLHSTLDQGQANNPALQASGGRLQFADRMPRYVSLEDTPSGLMMVSTAKRADGRMQYAAGPWMMPIFCTAGIAGPGIYSSNMRIPIDDESLMFYRLRWSYEPIPEKELFSYKHGEYVYPKLIPGTFTPVDNKANDYHIDRVAQRAFSYTGIKTFPLQDIAMMEDQRGPLMDRTKEHLASSDAAIIQVRRRLLGAAWALAEGKEPEAPWHPEAYAYHSARLVVDANTPVEQAVAEVEALAMQKSGQASMLVR
jgi:phthalate 4,5-dioxygenase oxygenase subunit